MTVHSASELKLRVGPAEERGLRFAEALVISASAVARPPLLYLVILAATDLADVVATERLQEHEEAAAGTRKFHVLTFQ